MYARGDEAELERVSHCSLCAIQLAIFFHAKKAPVFKYSNNICM